MRKFSANLFSVVTFLAVAGFIQPALAFDFVSAKDRDLLRARFDAARELELVRDEKILKQNWSCDLVGMSGMSNPKNLKLYRFERVGERLRNSGTMPIESYAAVHGRIIGENAVAEDHLKIDAEGDLRGELSARGKNSTIGFEVCHPNSPPG